VFLGQDREMLGGMERPRTGVTGDAAALVGIDREGRDRTVDEFQVLIQFAKRREWFQLGTANGASAAKKAAAIYSTLANKGWEVAVAEFKHRALSRKENPSVGDFFKAIRGAVAARTNAPNAQTLSGYFSKFRSIVAAIHSMPRPKSRFDYRHGGNAAWKEKVEAVPLSSIAVERHRANEHNRLQPCFLRPRLDRRLFCPIERDQVRGRTDIWIR
jgi:hypothetical protein